MFEYILNNDNEYIYILVGENESSLLIENKDSMTHSQYFINMKFLL